MGSPYLCRLVGLTVRLDDALAAAERAGRRVIAVAASAGSTATGAFDPLPEIAELCARRGLWLHVDGAHGASLALSRRLDQAPFRLRRRGPFLAHGSLRLGFAAPKRPTSSAFVDFLGSLRCSHRQPL